MAISVKFGNNIDTLLVIIKLLYLTLYITREMNITTGEGQLMNDPSHIIELLYLTIDITR